MFAHASCFQIRQYLLLCTTCVTSRTNIQVSKVLTTPEPTGKLHFDIPENVEDYFGKRVTNQEGGPLFRLRKPVGQLDLFRPNKGFVKLSVTQLWSALRCPWLFYHTYILKSIRKYPHHPIFDVGTKVDKFAKQFLQSPLHDRESTKNTFIDKFKGELTKLKSIQLSKHEVDKYG